MEFLAQGLGMRASGLKKASFGTVCPLKPGMWLPPQEALSGGQGYPLALGASGLRIKTCGFVVI